MQKHPVVKKLEIANAYKMGEALQNEILYEEIRKVSGHKFKHYKGGIYEVVGPLFNATTDRWDIEYKNGDARYIRSFEDFFEYIPRFKPCG